MQRAGTGALLAALTLSVAAFGQGKPPGDELSIAAIQSRIAAIDGAKADAATKATAKGVLQEAIEQLKKAQESGAAAAEFGRQASEAPKALEAIRKELAIAPADPRPSVPDKATLTQITQLRVRAEGDLTAAREQLAELKKESERRTEALKGLPEQIGRAKQALAKAEQALKLKPDPKVPPLVSGAQRTRGQAGVQALTLALKALESELQSYESRRDLIQARIDQAGRRVAQAEKLAQAWQGIEEERRKAETERATREAERALLDERIRNIPAVSGLAKRNQELAAVRSGPEGLSARLAGWTKDLAAVKERLANLRGQFQVTRRKVDAAGVTHALGLLLRKQLDRLPPARRLERGVEDRQETVSDIQYQLITSEEERSRFGDVERTLAELLKGIDGYEELPPAERAELAKVARELLTARQTLLNALIADYSQAFGTLVELDLRTRDLAGASREYEGYIEERALWVRSVAPRKVPLGTALGSAVSWLVRPGSWSVGLRESLQTSKQTWPWVVLGLLVLSGLVALRRYARSRLAGGKEVWRPESGGLMQTLEGLGWTLAIAAPVPVGVWLLGRWLVAPDLQPEVVGVLGRGLQEIGLLLLALEFVRHTLREGGIGRVHFLWPSASAKAIRRNLAWFVPLKVVTATLVLTFDRQEQDVWNDTLGRAVFLVGLLALVVFLQRVLRFDGPVMNHHFRRNAEGWVQRLRYLWYPLILGLPALLGILAVRGYYYTAVQLEGRLQASLALLLGVVLLNALLLRWIRLARLRIVTAEAPPPPAPAAPAPEGTEKSDSPAQAPAPPADPAPVDSAVGRVAALDAALHLDDGIDVAGSSAQIQRLFRSLLAIVVLLGLYAVWANHLPALKRLDQIQIWPRLGKVDRRAKLSFPALEGKLEQDKPAEDKPAPAPEGTKTEPAPTGPTPKLPVTPKSANGSGDEKTILEVVTLADLGLALILFAFTMVAARNIPGLLEIVLQKASSGTRYATSTLVRYVIVVLGIWVAFGTLGFRWNNLQWLVAALTFGLAFGLQEIFANFVSGLILLFEQPVRVGDWVTIGETSGVVTRIRIRATTITDWDRKELILPNKELVTGRVVNWSLTDTLYRVRIPVGVAYGSDTQRVHEVLLEIVRAHPSVLPEPRPSAWFRELADSSLLFNVRGVIADFRDRLEIEHEIRSTIHRRLREEGIEIAFPQRDLHLRSSDVPLWGPAGEPPAPAPAEERPADDGQVDGR